MLPSPTGGQPGERDLSCRAVVAVAVANDPGAVAVANDPGAVAVANDPEAETATSGSGLHGEIPYQCTSDALCECCP